VVSDNGPAYKSLDWLRFFAGRSELTHVRTRHRAPETNGVVERFVQTLKYEHLYRIEISDVLELQAEVDAFRQLYNTWRPHETLGQTPPIGHYLAEPSPEPNLSDP
jgi:transposase InsO family protein